MNHRLGGSGALLFVGVGVLGLASAGGCRGAEFQSSAGGSGGGGTQTSTSSSGTGGAQPVSASVAFVDIGDQALDARPYLLTDAEGAILEEGFLDGDGKVQVSGHEGDMVAVFENTGPASSRRYAYVAELALDAPVIRFAHRFRQGNTPVNVTLQADCPSCTGLDHVVFYASCAPPVQINNPAGSLKSYMFSGFAGCPGKSTFDAHIVIYNVADEAVQYASRTNIPLAAGLATLPDALGATSGTVPWSIQDQPAGFGALRQIARMRTDGSPSYEAWFGSGDAILAPKIPVEPAQSAAFSIMRTEARDPDKLQGIRRLQRVAGGAPLSPSLDAASLAFPVEVSALDRSLPAQPGVSVSLLAGPSGDALQATLSTSAVVWNLTRPASASGVFRIPQLNTALASWAFPTTGSTEVVLQHIEDVAAIGYGGLAAKAFTLDYDTLAADSDVLIGFEYATIP